jgi:hypothetical protein
MKANSALVQLNKTATESWLHHGYARVAAAVVGFVDRPARVKPAAHPSADALASSAHLFAQALREDSNSATDWLWYATQITDIAKRHYCIQRALDINPDSELARRALAELPPAAGANEKLFFAGPSDRSI